MAKLHSLIIALLWVCRNVTKKHHVMLTNSCFSCFQIIKNVIYQIRKLFEILTILLKQLMEKKQHKSVCLVLANSFQTVLMKLRFSVTQFSHIFLWYCFQEVNSCIIDSFYPLSEYKCAVISYKNNITLAQL